MSSSPAPKPHLSPVAERYEALIRVSQAIHAHRDPKDLFRALADELHRVMQFDGIVIAQFDESGHKITWKLCRICGCPDTVVPTDAPLEQSIAKWVYDYQQPLLIPSVKEETRFPRNTAFLQQQGLESVCVLPLTTVHRRLGSMGIASKHPEAYSEDEVRFLSLVAEQVALAIDDSMNFEASRLAQADLERNNERLKLLLDLNNAIVSNLDLRELLEAVSGNLRRVMQCDGVGIALEDGSDLNPMAPDMRSVVNAPLASRDRTLGVLSLGSAREDAFSAEDIAFIGQVANQVAIAVENALAYREIATLRDQLTQEKVYLEDEIRSELNFEEIVGRSAALRRVLQEVETVAPTDSTVLIYGETGTGKELIARAIHNLGARKQNAFVKLNCAAIPTGLLESELFGHEKGAFTGAVTQRIGRFELANHGTVFLDEVGEIPLELQPKLLRVLQEREFERLGSGRTLRSDARLIAATNRDLGAMVAEHRFRADLFYRLNVFPVQIPALRERQEDIPLLVRHFVQQFARRMNKVVDTIPAETMNVLVRYHWPGNIRELQNLVERAVILSTGPVLKVPLHDLQAQPAPQTVRGIERLEDAERRHILDALDATNWVISGPKGAAAVLGLKRSTLQARMEKLGIRRARVAEPQRRAG
jgi:formate hydrogenlyase transcriptional activator